jgi:ethylene receptor
MSLCKGLGFKVEVDKSLPNHVIGDEKRVFQVILHMVGNLIDGNHGGGILVFRVFAESGSRGRTEHGYATWRPSSSCGDVHIKFDVRINSSDLELETSVSSGQLASRLRTSDPTFEEKMSFSICQKIIQVRYLTSVVHMSLINSHLETNFHLHKFAALLAMFVVETI